MAVDTRTVSYEPFYEAVRAGHLAFPCCGNCGQFHWYPKPSCPHCGSEDIHWTAITGHGVIHTFTVVRYAFSAEVKDKLPYVVVFVEFADAPGVRFVSDLLVDPVQSIHIGARVEPVFTTGDPTVTTVDFRLADQSG
jgi:uncharacterized OB-fold protein